MAKSRKKCGNLAYDTKSMYKGSELLVYMSHYPSGAALKCGNLAYFGNLSASDAEIQPFLQVWSTDTSSNTKIHKYLCFGKNTSKYHSFYWCFSQNTSTQAHKYLCIFVFELVSVDSLVFIPRSGISKSHFCQNTTVGETLLIRLH